MNPDTRADVRAILRTCEGVGFSIGAVAAVLTLAVVLHSGVTPARELSPVAAFGLILACAARWLRLHPFRED